MCAGSSLCPSKMFLDSIYGGVCLSSSNVFLGASPKVAETEKSFPPAFFRELLAPTSRLRVNSGPLFYLGPSSLEELLLLWPNGSFEPASLIYFCISKPYWPPLAAFYPFISKREAFLPFTNEVLNSFFFCSAYLKLFQSYSFALYNSIYCCRIRSRISSCSFCRMKMLEPRITYFS